MVELVKGVTFFETNEAPRRFPDAQYTL